MNEGQKLTFLSIKIFFATEDLLHLCDCWIVVLQRLKAALSQQSPSGHSMGVMSTGSSPMVPQRAEQNQLLVQQPDAPSPAQPQVLSSNSWPWLIHFSKARKVVSLFFFFLLIYLRLPPPGISSPANRWASAADGRRWPRRAKAALSREEPGGGITLQAKTQAVGLFPREKGRGARHSEHLTVGEGNSLRLSTDS